MCSGGFRASVSNGAEFLVIGEAMSNGNPYERLWKLQTKVNMLVLDGKRDPEAVANVLQDIISPANATSAAAGEGFRDRVGGMDLSRNLSILSDFWSRRGFKVNFGIFAFPPILPPGFVLPLYEPEGISAEGACCLCEQGDKNGRYAFMVKRAGNPNYTKGSVGLSRPRLIVVRNTAEPDTREPADVLDRSGKLFETLRQRVLHEAFSFDCFGKHLDTTGGWTRCPESCFSSGEGARVNWDSDNRSLCVGVDYSNHQHSRADAREAIEIPLKV